MNFRSSISPSSRADTCVQGSTVLQGSVLVGIASSAEIIAGIAPPMMLQCCKCSLGAWVRWVKR